MSRTNRRIRNVVKKKVYLAKDFLMRHLSMVNSISCRYHLIASWQEDSDLGLPREFAAIIELEMGLDVLMEEKVIPCRLLGVEDIDGKPGREK
jgi:hypothetical protein